MQLDIIIVVMSESGQAALYTPEKGAPKEDLGSVVLKLCSCLMVCSSLYRFNTSLNPAP